MQKVAYFKDGNKNVEYEIMDKQARDDIAALPKEIIDKLTSPFSETGSVVQCHPVEDYPLGVAVNLNPVQEGSGDPYPAGGGKNLFPPVTISGSAGFTSVGDGTFKYVASGNTVIGSFTFKANTEYTLSTSHKSGSGNLPCVIVRNPSGDTTGQTSNYANVNNPVRVKFDVDTTWNIIFQAQSSAGVPTVGDTYTFQIETGSTATPFTPYSNIRPISGHTGVEVVRCGRNLLPKAISRTQERNGITFTSYGDGSYRVHGTCTAGGTSFSFGMESTAVIPKGAYWHLLNDGTCTNAAFAPKFTDNTTGSLAFSVDNRIYAIADKYVGQTIKEIGVYVANGETLDVTFRPMMCLDDAIAPFEPYHADTYPVSFGQTIYGGTVDVNEGETVETWKLLTLDGTERYIHVSSWADGAYQIENYLTDAPEVDGYANVAELTCSHAKAAAPQYIVGGRLGIGQGSGSTLYLNLGSQYNTADSIKAYLAAQHAAGTPVQIACKLAMPNTIATAAHNIPGLKGINIVYADSGTVTVNGRIDPEYLNNTVLTRLAALEAAAVN